MEQRGQLKVRRLQASVNPGATRGFHTPEHKSSKQERYENVCRQRNMLWYVKTLFFKDKSIGFERGNCWAC